jgi:RHS repeat-associated protein
MQAASTRYFDGGSAVLCQIPTLPGQASTNSAQSSAPGASTASSNGSNETLQSKLPNAPVLSLPNGGGAIQGMGEKFTVNSSNGTGTLVIPLKVPPGRSGLQPQLSLGYDSGNGNGEFGLGWRLSGIDSISRKTSKGMPQYNDFGSDADADVFLLAGSEDLVPLWKQDQSGAIILDANGNPEHDEKPINGYIVRKYGPRIVTVFNRIERWANSAKPNDIHWRVISPENITGVFGSSESSRVYDTSASRDGNQRIYAWLQDEVYDSQGNAIVFTYKREDSTNVVLTQAHEMNRSDDARRAQLYLKTIKYGNIVPNRDLSTWKAFSALTLPQNNTTWKYSIVLDYGEHSTNNPKLEDTGDWTCRSDPSSRYHAGFEVRTYRLCRRILVFHHFDELSSPDYLVSSFDFTYDQNPRVTYLTAVERNGFSDPPQPGGDPFRKSLPPVEFEYSKFPTDDELAKIYVKDVDPGSLENLPIGLDGATYRWVDIDGEGISGILAFHQNAWYYKRNTSASNFSANSSSDDTLTADDNVTVRLGDLELINSGPFLTGSSLNMQFADVTGNGKLDLVSHATGKWGYYERSDDETLLWTEFHPFENSPDLKPDRNIQFVDITGDGIADILIYEDQVYTWYPSLGPDGYGAPQTSIQSWDEAECPVCVFADSEQCVYLADMSGDGLVDICRIRNGDCCYWPQLGYGKFGRQICMDNAPWSDFSNQFDHNLVKIADIDGSGTSDILYLTDQGVDIYLNQSGNSFADKKPITLPSISKTSVVNIVDLLGNGTNCIVWSSSLPGDANIPMKYIDIFHNRKPNLLIQSKNNLGEETRISYAPSTKFYLQDKQRGCPWITRLQFPVQCVEVVETLDTITGNSFHAQYRYSHGYFDGVEREFRGFARVEQTDKSNFVTSTGLSSTNVNASWNVPPIRTLTWFHTGVYFNDQTMMEQLSQEYFGANPNSSTQPAQLIELDHTIIPPECVEGLQMMEACRALKGRTLRMEIYSDDGNDNEHIPYSVQETNFTIVPTQTMQDAHLHGIYFVHPRETLACSYERVAQDPRITHQMVLDVDDFGNVRKDIRISYGRLAGQSQLDPAHAAQQEATQILYHEADLTNSLHGNEYRIPVTCESRQYELRGLKLSGTNTRFQYTDMVADYFAAILSIPEIQFEVENNPNLPQKRLLRKERALFQSDNLSGLLPVGVIQSLALPGAYHKLAFTPGLFLKLFTRASPLGSQTSLLSSSDALNSGGYVDLDGDGRLWTASPKVSYTANATSTTAQELSEARSSFFLPKTFIDIFNNPKSIGYDKYCLFPVSSLDAVGNVTTVVADYRTLQIAMVTDLNGNVSSAAYDALGMVAGVAISGRSMDNLGDSITGFQSDLPQSSLDEFLANPTPQLASSLLGNATSRILYDPWRVSTAHEPIYSAFISRETHVNSPPPSGGALFQVQFTYSDGFGRVIQRKSRTSPGPILDQGPSLPDRWVATGWTVFNNKGKPVQQFEPFFDSTASFQANMTVGVSSISVYDPIDRIIAKIRPDHAIEKTVFTTWSQSQYDTNDNLLLSDPRQDPDIGHFFSSIPTGDFLPSWYDARKTGSMGKAEQDTATKTIPHNNTPNQLYLDSMGRVFLTITVTPSDTIEVNTQLDILGNARVTVDALGRKSSSSDFDMCQRKIYSTTIDSGASWGLPDGSDQKWLSWNNRGFHFRSEYDKLRRIKNYWWQDAGTTTEILTSQTIYGEDYASVSDTSDTAAEHNLRGHTWQVLDQSGIVEFTDYDLDGNVTRSTRRMAAEYKNVFNISSTMLLDSEPYVKSESFDVLRRSVRSVAPDGTITCRVYGQTTQLARMYVNVKGEHDPNSDPTTWTPILTHVQYNPKGQVTNTVLGNGSQTIHTYDKLLYRLRAIESTSADGKSLQSLTYSYDPVGNICHVEDSALQTIFFRNNVVNPSNDFTYDALYRLISASGREHLGQVNGGPPSPVAPDWSDKTHQVSRNNAGDGSTMGLYTETYKYDAVGNLMSLQHSRSDAQSPGWTRKYVYNESSLIEQGKLSNRLSQTSIGSAFESYRYDGSAGLTGNMTSMSHLPVMNWDFADRLKSTSKQTVAQGTGNTPEMTYYVYDAQGRRVRKVTESQSGQTSSSVPVKIKETIYLDDLETFNKYTNSTAVTSSPPSTNGAPSESLTTALRRTTFHASTEYGHMADICVRTVGTDDGVARQTRFQLHNHLGSAVLELDDTGALISYEEYYPFGSTSYKAVPRQTDVPKRFRFSGKELDSENGLYYFGARYYASWLGRWTAADPVVDQESRYEYVKNNPVRLVDPDGRSPVAAPGGGGGADDNSGWIDVEQGAELGKLVHDVALAVLQTRLTLRGLPSEGEYRTLPGGSKNDPLVGKDAENAAEANPDKVWTQGRMDLAVFTHTIPTLNQFVAHVYELKPDNKASNLTDGKAYEFQSETQLYSKFFPDAQVVAQPGSIIEDLDKQDKQNPQGNGILDPIELKTKLGDVRIKFRLEDSDAKGNKVRGLILYQVQVRPKNGKPSRELAQSIIKLAIAMKVAQSLAARKAQQGGQVQQGQPAQVTPASDGPGVGAWVLSGVVVIGLIAIASTGVGALLEGGALTATEAGGGGLLFLRGALQLAH